MHKPYNLASDIVDLSQVFTRLIVEKDLSMEHVVVGRPMPINNALRTAGYIDAGAWGINAFCRKKSAFLLLIFLKTRRQILILLP